MILLAFFLPVAVYLLILGGINRRRSPLMVSGVWDFIGVLFAASGFLLLGGPAIISSVNERARDFWLLGKTGGQPSSDGWQLWIYLALCYFGLVVAGSVFLLWSHRRLTSIYNVEPAVLQHCLQQVFERLRLNPVRSGGLYLFGLAGEPSSAPAGAFHESIQAPHHLPGSASARLEAVPHSGGESEFLGQTAILEVDVSAALRHVTLRWDPVDSLFRREIEAQLQQLLSKTSSEEADLGAWLLLSGLGLLAVLFLGGILILLLRALGRD